MQQQKVTKKLFNRDRLRGRRPRPTHWISLTERMAFAQFMYNREMAFMWGQKHIDDKEEEAV